MAINTSKGADKNTYHSQRLINPAHPRKRTPLSGRRRFLWMENRRKEAGGAESHIARSQALIVPK